MQALKTRKPGPKPKQTRIKYTIETQKTPTMHVEKNRMHCTDTQAKSLLFINCHKDYYLFPTINFITI